MTLKHLFHNIMIFCTVVCFGLGSFIPSTLATSVVSIMSDTAVLLSGPGITLILASGSTVVSFSVNTTTLTVNLDVSSTVTIKSNNLYTLTNSQSLPTLCGTGYSFITLTSATPAAVTITPSTTIACPGGTAPFIPSFSATPTAITAGQSSTLSWTTTGATTVSIDQSIGDQTATSTGSALTSPVSTTTYTLTAVNGTGTSTAMATVTVSAAQGGGNGGGGTVITPPVITSFSASPSSIAVGQSSTLMWSVTGASGISITPAVGTSSLSSTAGTLSATPATTTTYTLTATNLFSQSTSATATITVTTGNNPQPALPTSPVTPPSSQPGGGLSLPGASPNTAGSPAYCLVNNLGTYYLILNGIRRGIANPGLLFSYGYNFNNALTDTAAYQSLPSGELLGPNDGSLVKAPANPTVYLISGGTKHGFTSATVFRSLGYKFASVLNIPAAQLDGLGQGDNVSNSRARHLQGANTNSLGTIYLLGETQRFAYPSLSVFNTWNLHNDFSRVVPPNAADLALPIGPEVISRTFCSG